MEFLKQVQSPSDSKAWLNIAFLLQIYNVFRILHHPRMLQNLLQSWAILCPVCKAPANQRLAFCYTKKYSSLVPNLIHSIPLSLQEEVIFGNSPLEMRLVKLGVACMMSASLSKGMSPHTMSNRSTPSDHTVSGRAL